MIKNIFAIFIFSLLFVACSTNELSKQEKEVQRQEVSKELLSDISYILFLLKQKDLDNLNSRFINPKIGLYEVYKSDIENKITFKHSYEIDEIVDIIDSFEIKQEIIIFNCSPYNDAFYGWNKDGTFLTTQIKPYLSQIIQEQNKITPNKYKIEELANIALIEKTSYELIVTNNVIFYLTKIDNLWYITLIDKIKTDCSK
jgi:hypothetical protein